MQHLSYVILFSSQNTGSQSKNYLTSNHQLCRTHYLSFILKLVRILFIFQASQNSPRVGGGGGSEKHYPFKVLQNKQQGLICSFASSLVSTSTTVLQLCPISHDYGHLSLQVAPTASEHFLPKLVFIYHFKFRIMEVICLSEITYENLVK